MPGDENTQTPAPAAPAAPAAPSSTTALEAQIKVLQKEAADLQAARGGAQKLAADEGRRADTLASELSSTSENLQRLMAELETQRAAVETSNLSLEETMARAAAAERQTKVLQLAGQVQPELVSLLTGAGVKIEVPGESDEDISNALKSFSSILTKFHQPGAAVAAPQLPDTPGAPTSTSGAPAVPGEGGAEAQRVPLMRKAIELAGQPGQQAAMDAVLAQIEALGAK